jgi:hypothetical protein
MGNICTISIDFYDNFNVFEIVDIFSSNGWSITQKNSDDVYLITDIISFDQKIINTHDFSMLSLKNKSQVTKSQITKNENKRIAGCYLFKENMSISFVILEESNSILFFVDDLAKEIIETAKICTFDFAITEVVIPFSKKGICISRFSCEQDLS